MKFNFGKNGCTPRACKWWILVIYLLCNCSAYQSHLPDVPTTFSELCSYLAKRFLIGIKPKEYKWIRKAQLNEYYMDSLGDKSAQKAKRFC